ncbi:response regulator transcription factor [Myroides injenensis]|uniref:response regulator transcription factor n=1 Tax=Myroides injenensis TaxID=1183151 RepID=UPI0002E2A56D|nr:helix-turn-helix transcriptional regulator [Myroides injenensis]
MEKFLVFFVILNTLGLFLSVIWEYLPKKIKKITLKVTITAIITISIIIIIYSSVFQSYTSLVYWNSLHIISAICSIFLCYLFYSNKNHLRFILLTILFNTSLSICLCQVFGFNKSMLEQNFKTLLFLIVLFVLSIGYVFIQRIVKIMELNRKYEVDIAQYILLLKEYHRLLKQEKKNAEKLKSTLVYDDKLSYMLKNKYQLTSREIEVLFLLWKQQDTKSICDSLGFSYNTLRFHISNIYNKLKVKSRTELSDVKYKLLTDLSS